LNLEEFNFTGVVSDSGCNWLHAKRIDRRHFLSQSLQSLRRIGAAGQKCHACLEASIYPRRNMGSCQLHSFEVKKSC
jgi:hypothetical protein